MSVTRRPVARIYVLRCPHGVRALAVGDTRITAVKCCGEWRTVDSFGLAVSGKELGDLVTIAEANVSKKRSDV